MQKENGLRVEFFQKLNFRRMRKEWWWRAVSTDNGNKMAGSLEGYVRLVDCEAAQRKVANRMANSPMVWIYADGTIQTVRTVG
jgi:hypothetical protein